MSVAEAREKSKFLDFFHETTLEVGEDLIESIDESNKSEGFQLESIIREEIHERHESEVDRECQSTTRTPRDNGRENPSKDPNNS